MRRNFGPTKDSREKNFAATKYPPEKHLDPEIPTRKKLGPTKYQRENILGPQNTYEKKCQTHDGTMAREPWNLARSIQL